MRPRSLILVMGCEVALGCGTDPDVFHSGCRNTDVTLQVGSGLTPEIDWSLDCEVGVVTVLQYAAADSAAEGTALDVAWQIHSPGNDEGPNNLLTPSVRYGRVSGGALSGISGRVPSGRRLPWRRGLRRIPTLSLEPRARE